MVKEELVEEAVRRVQLRLQEPLHLDTLSIEGMLEVGYGLALCPEAKRIFGALLQGRRVVLAADGLEARQVEPGCPAALRRLLRAGEERLAALGVQIEAVAVPNSRGKRPLVTLARAEKLFGQGQPLPPNALITPAAADYWKEQGKR